MSTEKEFLEKVSALDFDPARQAQKRVWARVLHQSAPRRSLKPLAWGICTGLLLMLGGISGMYWSDSLQDKDLPQSTAFWQRAQCKKADGRVLVSTELECHGEKCSCTKTMTICDEHPVTRVTRKNCKTPPSDFDPQDPWNLWNDDAAKQTKDLAFCQNQC